MVTSSSAPPAVVSGPAPVASPPVPGVTAGPTRPNILLVMLDDLGWGELGSYGQQVIQTPVLDGLAAQGVRFDQAYTTPTCAPTRCSLMTGRHIGHTQVRSNADAGRGLLPEAVTVAGILRQAGYTTGHIGKWGLGPENGVNPSHPNSQGFDYFFGYLNQRHAHDYWPTYLWRNDERVLYPENESANVTYAEDLFTQEALDFIERSKQDPFFLYLSYTTPHAPNEVPTDAPYSDRPWPQGERNHAAQITRTDAEIGRLLTRLAELGLADHTLVLVTSDNGPHAEGAHYAHVGSTLPHDPEFFDSNGPLRGIKRDLYEGGIRVPLIVRPPVSVRGHPSAAPGSVVRDPVAVWDFLPTFAEVAGAEAPPGLDGVSFAPALTGGRPGKREYLYWECREGRYGQAVRFGKWKAVRLDGGPIELYDLHRDLGERHNLASTHLAQVRRAERLMAAAVAGA